MIFSLDVRRARKGDCLLLHFGTKDDPGLVMIDGGPASVYGPFLKPRLRQIREARGLGNHPLPVDLLMVSHVDDDHIRGILDLTRDLLANKTAPLVRIQSFWHNSFDDVIGNDPKELTSSVSAKFGAASLGGELPADIDLDSDQHPEVVRSTMQVLASIEQGHRLRGDIKALGAEPNADFDGKLIMAGDRVNLSDDVAMRIAGPMLAELQDLQRDHDKWLDNRGAKTPEESLAAYVDSSVPNLSSIVVLAESGGKTILLTGDARGDRILEGLETTGVLAKGASMHIDVLKVPHHGSSNNLDNDFFQRLRADHYVFSGDGEHGNPERESLEMLLNARGADPFEIHLTYPIDEIDQGRKEDWEKEQKKERERQAKGSKKPLREDWSPEHHSLAALLASRPLGPGQTIRIAQTDAPHVIDLLDPLGY